MRVLHLIETLGSGGAERLLHTNLKNFDSQTVESEVVTVFGRGSYWAKQIRELGVRVTSLDCSGFRDIGQGIRRLRKHIGKHAPDVIHTHLWAANVIGRIAGKRAGVPVLSSIHNPEYEPEVLGVFSGATRRKISIARQVDKWTARYGCTRMIAVSEYVRESANKRLGFPLDLIDVIYNPINVDEKSTRVDRKSLFNSIGLPMDAAVLLTVGRVEPQKGLVYAIRALKETVEKQPKAHLVSIGALDNADYLKQVEAEIDMLGIQKSVHLLGERRDVSDFLRAADVFLFPSLFEGLGIALAEAMAAGLPCVASNIRPLDEFVTNGENGILVPPREPSILNEAVVGLLGSPETRNNLGEAARATAYEMFQPRPAADRLTEVYRALAGVS